MREKETVMETSASKCTIVVNSSDPFGQPENKYPSLGMALRIAELPLLTLKGIPSILSVIDLHAEFGKPVGKHDTIPPFSNDYGTEI